MESSRGGGQDAVSLSTVVAPPFVGGGGGDVTYQCNVPCNEMVIHSDGYIVIHMESRWSGGQDGERTGTWAVQVGWFIIY